MKRGSATGIRETAVIARPAVCIPLSPLGKGIGMGGRVVSEVTIYLKHWPVTMTRECDCARALGRSCTWRSSFPRCVELFLTLTRCVVDAVAVVEATVAH